MELSWRRCAGDTWCPFETAVLPDANASGILLIWSGSFDQIVYVAHGGIAKNLKWARQFQPIAGRPNLFVTWSSVPEELQPGVQNFLVDRLRPVHRERPTADAAVAVNLPWERGAESPREVKEGRAP